MQKSKIGKIFGRMWTALACNLYITSGCPHAVHLPGVLNNNLADAVSRDLLQVFFQLHPGNQLQFQPRYGTSWFADMSQRVCHSSTVRSYLSAVRLAHGFQDPLQGATQLQFAGGGRDPEMLISQSHPSFWQYLVTHFCKTQTATNSS